jgi:hypothetical protein
MIERLLCSQLNCLGVMDGIIQAVLWSSAMHDKPFPDSWLFSMGSKIDERHAIRERCVQVA